MRCMHCSSGRYEARVLKQCSTCGDVWKASKGDEKKIKDSSYHRGLRDGLKKAVEISQGIATKILNNWGKDEHGKERCEQTAAYVAEAIEAEMEGGK